MGTTRTWRLSLATAVLSTAVAGFTTFAAAEETGKTVLFDNTHEQTAGASDWVIDGGFSDYADSLKAEGYQVKALEQTTPITYDDLKGYQVFVIPEASVPYKASEQAAIVQYVQNGGSVFYIADHYNADRNKNRWDAGEIFNGYRRGAFDDPTKGMSADEANSTAMQGVVSSDWLSSTFGVRFRYNALDNVSATDIATPSESFGITTGVTSVALHAGSTIAITDPTKAKGIVYLPSGLTAANKWANAVDQGVYDGGGHAEGAYVAISKYGKGKAAFIGDSSAVEDATPKYLNEETGKKKTTYDGFTEESDGVLLDNVVNWLSTPEDYTDLTQTTTTLDTKTALLDSETPQNSTEPQAEPWATPQTGYKWYDKTTFAAGSYGSTKVVTDPTTNASYALSLQDANTVKLVVTGLAANTTYSGYSLGIYLTGGTQVAAFKNDDGTYPTAAGYSATFSLTTDANGQATVQRDFQLPAGNTGSASLRLRQTVSGKTTNLQTTTVNLLSQTPEIVVTPGTVSISGTAQVGHTLQVDAANWEAGVTLSYQWFNDGVAINGATEQQLALTPEMAQHAISVAVRGTSTQDPTKSATVSAEKVTIANGDLTTTTPTITGTAKVGQTVTADTTGWTDGTQFTYQWFVNGQAIAGATQSIYQLTKTDANQTVTVQVTGKLAGYNDATLTSDSIKVAPVASTPTSGLGTLLTNIGNWLIGLINGLKGALLGWL